MGRLTEAQRKVLALLESKYPDPVTIYDDGDHLRGLLARNLIYQWDVWPDGTRRWAITPAGRAALAEEKRDG